MITLEEAITHVKANAAKREGTAPMMGELFVAEIERLRAHVEQLQAKLHCMCGSSVDGHGMGDGHSPVSMYDYSLDQAQAERDRLRAVNAEMREALELSVGRFQAISDLVRPGLNSDVIAHSLAILAKTAAEDAK